MKEIQLTKGYVALVDDADFEWLNQWKWHIISTHGGRHISSKRTQWPGRKGIYMHRQILGITDKNILVDHIDGNPLNNQRSNLRACNRYENARNSKPQFGKKYKGATWNKAGKKWVARIVVNNSPIYIGRFNTLNEALTAYNEAAIKYHGEFAWLNEIMD